MAHEEWRDVVGYEGLYQVSNIGRVKSMGWTVAGPNGSTCRRQGRIIKQSIKRDGYCQVRLYRDKTHKDWRVHRLVALAFIGEGGERQYIDHIDGNRTNNAVDNLRWCTPSENTNYAICRGTINLDNLVEAAKTTTERRGRRWCMTRVIRDDGVIYESIADAAKDLGVSRGSVHNALNGKTMTCKGHSLRILEKQGIDEAVARGATDDWYQMAKQARPVIRSDGEWFPSVRAAARAIGAKDSNIGKVAQGKRKTCMGFSFKYADEDVK